MEAAPGSRLRPLVGVASFNPDSGVWHGRRSIWGGRARVRAVLYMVTLTAVRRHPRMRGSYQRRIAARKPPKVALTACLRKLLVLCNALCHHQPTWDLTMPKLSTPQHRCSPLPPRHHLSNHTALSTQASQAAPSPTGQVPDPRVYRSPHLRTEDRPQKVGNSTDSCVTDGSPRLD